MANTVVLMVGEKPSIASNIARYLSHSKHTSRKGKSPACAVHEWKGFFPPLKRDVLFRMTSTLGHVYGIDFPPEYQSWDSTDPLSLFDAPTVKNEENPKTRVASHIRAEAKGAEYLVLWLDCDREGENICFEVMSDALPKMKLTGGGQRVFRAKFSALTQKDLQYALSHLISPNEAEARAVDARQELDLKVGVAFTRFQTRYFQGKYANLDSRLISYGPCQTPTLGFCVDRHDEISCFQPEPFWTLKTVLAQHKPEGIDTVAVEWERKRVFDHEIASLMQKRVKRAKSATCLSCSSKSGSKQRPIPLNTVEMLRMASEKLSMSPHHTMQVAERLYTSGYLSYPRTESTKYPDNYDLTSAVKLGLNKSRGGVDAGDHPPITPMRTAVQHDLAGHDDWILYDMVTRVFLATISPNCKYTKTTARFAAGGEYFKLSGKHVTSEGFTLILPWMSVAEQTIPMIDAASNHQWTVNECIVSEGKTSPPDYLTESELISLMERNGIGTDASISVHINNICERNYVQVVGNSRTLVPTAVGISLAHGYHRIDPEIVLPVIRSNVEKYLDMIAREKASFEEVVQHSLAIFVEKFKYFVRKITRMDELFEANFTSLAETTGKFSSKCGKCKKYMKFIHLKPARMYCPTCDEVYKLPENVNIKLYQELTCPLDGFELVLVTFGTGQKRYPLCPFCYNYPVLDNMEAGLGCNSCPHPTCRHAMVRHAITDCEECDNGVMILDVLSHPKWRIDCNKCNFNIHIAEGAYKIVVLPNNKCPQCAASLLSVDFNKKNTPLPDGQTEYRGCIRCDELLNSLTKVGHSKMKHPMFRRGRGGRKRGRGKRRGGR